MSEGAVGLIRIVLPECDDDALSEAMRAITRAIEDSGREVSGGLLGGSDGYGGWFDGPVFMMHPYCWCEQDDCAWCGGCRADFPDPIHGEGCYQKRLDVLKQKHGRQESWGWYVPFGHREHEKAVRALCGEMGLSYPEASAVHCTCGASAEYQAEHAACQCDYCLPSGVFAANGAERKRGAPNFWHKPSGLKVWWYKYIGRGMEVVDPNGADIARVLLECLSVVARQPAEA